MCGVYEQSVSEEDSLSKGPTVQLVLLTMLAAQLAGFKAELAILEAHPRLNMSVHITKAPKSPNMSPPETPKAVEIPSPFPSPFDEKLESELRIEKLPVAIEKEAVPLPSYAVPGRPNVLATVRRIAEECMAEERVLVAACGPTGLSDGVKDAVKECTRTGGPSLKLHLEAFGW